MAIQREYICGDILKFII